MRLTSIPLLRRQMATEGPRHQREPRAGWQTLNPKAAKPPGKGGNSDTAHAPAPDRYDGGRAARQAACDQRCQWGDMMCRQRRQGHVLLAGIVDLPGLLS